MKDNMSFFQTIWENIENSTTREEYKYWDSLLQQALEIGIEFAQETYEEDLEMNGGELKWD